MQTGANISDTAKDLMAAAVDDGSGGLGLKPRIWNSVQNTGSSTVYIFEGGAAAPSASDVRRQTISAGETVDLMSEKDKYWAYCASGETSILASNLSGRPTRY